MQVPSHIVYGNGLLILNVKSSVISSVWFICPLKSPLMLRKLALFMKYLVSSAYLLVTVHSLKKILSFVTFQLPLKVSNVSSLPLPRSFHLGLSFSRNALCVSQISPSITLVKYNISYFNLAN